MQSSFLGTSNGLRAGRAFAPSRVSPVVPTVVAHYGGKANLGGGKPWERTQVNHNGKPVKVEMHVKKGDIVQVGAVSKHSHGDCRDVGLERSCARSSSAYAVVCCSSSTSSGCAPNWLGAVCSRVCVYCVSGSCSTVPAVSAGAAL